MSAEDAASPERAAEVREAVMLYQRRGDFDGALALLQAAGRDRRSSLDLLRTSDERAARATALLAVVLIVVGVVGLILWPDARWVFFALPPWGVERAIRAVTLVRRARALER
jgi:hypothetical protein